MTRDALLMLLGGGVVLALVAVIGTTLRAWLDIARINAARDDDTPET